jgi:hypothetical protein
MQDKQHFVDLTDLTALRRLQQEEPPFVSSLERMAVAYVAGLSPAELRSLRVELSREPRFQTDAPAWTPSSQARPREHRSRARATSARGDPDDPSDLAQALRGRVAEQLSLDELVEDWDTWVRSLPRGRTV